MSFGILSAFMLILYNLLHFFILIISPGVSQGSCLMFLYFIFLSRSGQKLSIDSIMCWWNVLNFEFTSKWSSRNPQSVFCSLWWRFSRLFLRRTDNSFVSILGWCYATQGCKTWQVVTYVVNQHRTFVVFAKFLVNQYVVNQGGSTMCDSGRSGYGG